MTAKKSRSPKIAEATRKRNFRHGFAARGAMSAEYKVWAGMIKRCHNESNPRYADYGGRGIAVADEWRHDFPAFFAHVGPRPSPAHEIDRIDNDRGYAPGNVRWATRIENGRNTRRNVLIEIYGVTKCAAAWDEQCGFPFGGKTVLNRYRRGWRGAELLLPRGTVVKPRQQSAAERAKRSATFKRLHAEGVFKASIPKMAATRKRQHADGTAYNKRDARGCFVSHE